MRIALMSAFCNLFSLLALLLFKFVCVCVFSILLLCNTSIGRTTTVAVLAMKNSRSLSKSTNFASYKNRTQNQHQCQCFVKHLSGTITNANIIIFPDFSFLKYISPTVFIISFDVHSSKSTMNICMVKHELLMTDLLTGSKKGFSFHHTRGMATILIYYNRKRVM